MRPTIRIAEPDGFSPDAVARLRTAADVELSACTPTELPAALATCDVFWFRLGHRIDAEALASARARVIATAVTGLDHIDLEACEAAGIRVVSLRGETAFLRQIRGTAELTIGLLLGLIRHIPAAHSSVIGGGWNRDDFRGRELYGRVAGLVGVGRLGSIVADYLRAVGMTVIGFDPRPDLPAGVERVDDLGELFARSDVVSVHATYDATTHHRIDANVLARAKQGLVLINTARGGIVDSGALLDALQRGVIAGAALDVIEGEPAVGAAHPLVAWARDNENLILTPHIGGNTHESFARTELFLADKVIDALRELGLA